MSVAEAPTQTPAQAPTSTWHMYRALVGIGVMCGLLIVTVFQVTKPIIAANKARALKAAIFRVVPAAATSGSFTFTANDQVAVARNSGPTDVQTTVHAGFDKTGALLGFAIEAKGMGYQDVIHVLYGYSVKDNAITGIQVLDSRETPGLGDKIDKDPAFLANFRRLDVSLDASGSALAHPIEAVKHGTKKHPWQIDAITGATISSYAVGNMLAKSAAHWIPKLKKNVKAFAQPTGGDAP